MAARLRSNWRRPAQQSTEVEPVEGESEQPAALSSDDAATTSVPPSESPPVSPESQTAPSPAVRRSAGRGRTRTTSVTGDPTASADESDSGASAPPAAARRGTRRRSPRAGQDAAVPVEPAGELAPAPEVADQGQALPHDEQEQRFSPGDGADLVLSPALHWDDSGRDESGTGPGQRPGTRRPPFASRARRSPAGREEPVAREGEPGSAAIPASPTFASVDYEPLPPPTKRKAPRNGLSATRGAQPAAENAVDWALGRVPAAAPAPAEDGSLAEAPLTRRRRSRRGRRGHGGAGEPPAGDSRAQLAEAVEVAAVERPPAAARPRQTPAETPMRDERTRSQLSTFESLVARQNVVLDALLTKVASFSSIERALMAIERRLSSQGYGATGTSAPRVGIFVDVPNIVYAADRIGVTIDFGKLLHILTRGRELVRASAYAPISDDLQQRLDTQKFVQPFVHRGYRIVTKPLKRFSDGTMKGNFDVELAMDVLTMSDRLDIVSLVSGDGDFSRLVEIVGSKGLRVEVVAFGSSTSSELRAICDDYIDISDHLDELT